LDVIEIEMREERDGKRAFETLAEGVQTEAGIRDETRVAIGETGLSELVMTCFDQRWICVDAEIASAVEIAREMHTAAQRTAADVEQPIARLQAAREEKIELQPADLVPHAAHHVAMIAAPNRLGIERAPIFVDAGKRGRRLWLRAHGDLPAAAVLSLTAPADLFAGALNTGVKRSCWPDVEMDST